MKTDEERAGLPPTAKGKGSNRDHVVKIYVESQ